MRRLKQTMLLGEILLHRGLITSRQLEEALRFQSREKRPLGEVLLQSNSIDEYQLETALKEQYWRVNGYWVIHSGLSASA